MRVIRRVYTESEHHPYLETSKNREPLGLSCCRTKGSGTRLFLATSYTPGRRRPRSARVFAKHDPPAIVWSGECCQRSLCPNPDLPCASRAAELLYAVGVHGRAGAPVP